MENTVAKKLDALLKLQGIDSEIDRLQTMRGDLPDEVKDLEDEVEGYRTRISNFQADVHEVENTIAGLRISMKEAEAHIAKNTEQQQNVRNNREYDAIAKEIESRQLDIKLAEKRIKDSLLKIDTLKAEIEKIQTVVDGRSKDLEQKKSELNTIVAESQEEENKLKADRDKALKSVDERLLLAYTRVRGNMRNGLAVVTVKRDACGGCYNIVPPQRQSEIREKKKIIVCEHCGRILADVDFIEPKVIAKPKRKSAASKDEE